MKIKNLSRAMWKERATYLELLPTLILLLFIAFIPLAYGIILGLTDFSLLRPTETSFVGLKNFFEQLISSRYHEALWHTLLYTVAITGGSYVIGLLIALLINARQLRAKKIFRVAILIPWVVTPVVVGIVWGILMRSRYGLINYILIKAGFSNINFLGDPQTALGYILIPSLWRTIPFVVIMLFARLRGVPAVMYEAARVDGATRWQQLLYITLPELKSVSEILLLYMVLMNSKVFDIIWVLTRGGPGNSTQVAMTYIYDLTFQRWQMNAGSAASYVPMIILFMVGYAYIRLREKAID